MGTIIRRNERSWAIVIISEIKVMLNGLGLKIKSAGGESTLSVNKKSMFPDVLYCMKMRHRLKYYKAGNSKCPMY